MDLNRLDNFDDLKEEAEKSTFFGVEVKHMTRDELLCMIGWLVKDNKRWQNRHFESFGNLRKLRRD